MEKSGCTKFVMIATLTASLCLTLGGSARAADQFFATGNSMTFWLLSLVDDGGHGTLKILYVEFGIPVMHEISYDLAAVTHVHDRVGHAYQMNISRYGHPCGSPIVVERSESYARIRDGDQVDVLSRMRADETKEARATLKEVASLQRPESRIMPQPTIALLRDCE